MNKKILIGFVTIYFLLRGLDFLVHGVLLAPLYDWLSRNNPGLFRPQEEMKIGVMFVCNLVFSFFFAYFFSKGYTGKGILEGIRYGLYVALMVTLPGSAAEYALHPIPYSVAVKWFLFGAAEYMIAGAVLAIIFGSAKQGGPAAHQSS